MLSLAFSGGRCRYYLFGWAFAYGDKLDDSGNSVGNAFIGTNQFAMSTTDASKFNTFIFQYVVRLDRCSTPDIPKPRSVLLCCLSLESATHPAHNCWP